MASGELRVDQERTSHLGGDCRREPQCILLALDKDLLTIRGTDVLGGV